MFDEKKLADPRVFQENRLPAHSDHAFYADALELAAGETSLVRSLSGIWHFLYAAHPRLLPEGVLAEDFPVEALGTIRVPGHIQLEGYGVPQYTNITYPWDGHEEVRQGEAPRRVNPVAVYFKDFTLPEEWEGANLALLGADSAVAVYLNGEYVGYSEDSFLPAEFDLTKHLRPGQNRLVLEVFRYSSGSWLEDQDFWRFSGLFREVQLIRRHPHHVENLAITAKPVNGYRDGELELAACFGLAAKRRLKLVLYGPSGDLVLVQEQEGVKESFSFGAEVTNASLWSAEKPNLYRIVLFIYDEAGVLREVVSEQAGFRSIALEDGLVKVNGKRVVFKGVNRHEFDCDRGRALDQSKIEADIRLMKQNNINALRCSHYPNATEVYRLCDRYGLYVIDETNLETHGSWMRDGAALPDEYSLPNDRAEWKDAVLDRAKSMLERDKNHASILFWSCGNESYGGSTLAAMSDYFRQADGSRLVHYESIFWDRRYPATSDVESQMYTSAKNIEKFLAENPEKPFICCEYAHSMGNSNGDLSHYTELAYRNPRYQGGFIWDFVDQAIRTKNRYGEEYLAYGGDFGDRPTDYNFSGNGIVFADRTPTPKLQEVKYCYQNFVLQVSPEEITIENRSLFTEAEEYALRVTIALDGTEIWRGELPMGHIAPGETGTVSLENLPVTDAGEEAVTAEFLLRTDTLWARAGHAVAFGQGVWQVEEVELPAEDAVEATELTGPSTLSHRSVAMPLETAVPLHIVQGDNTIGIHGTGFSYLFSSAQGNLTSFRVDGVELLDAMPAPSFWRAPVDNDYGARRDFQLAQWKLASLYRRCVKKEVRVGEAWQECRYYGELGRCEQRAESFALRFTYELATNPLSSCTVTYEVAADGVLSVTLGYEKVAGLPEELPDFAVVFTIPADYSHIRFYGYGPQECYADRQEGARLGLYETETTKELTPYLLPQECGNHTGVRWLEVTDHRGRGVRIFGDVSFEASALPHSAHELETARHAYELPPIHHTYLRASAGQSGVGGDDSWGSQVLPEYRAKNETKTFTFCIRGI